MIEHTQTILANQIEDPIFGEGLFVPGNCIQAAVASLLDLPMEAVPHFALMYDWRRTLNGWLNSRSKKLRIYSNDEGARGSWFIRDVPSSDLVNAPSGQMMIACGNSARGVSHTVLWKAGELVWDPHPSRAGLVGTPFELWQVTDR